MSGEWAKSGKYETERATELDRRTREEIKKSGIKLRALRFQTGGRGDIRNFPASLRGRLMIGEIWKTN